MPLPATYDLELYRGDSYHGQLRLWEDEARTMPVDLTGAIGHAEIREKTAGDFVVILGCEVIEPNIIDLQMTPEMYEGCPSKGRWDVQITYPDGNIRTMVRGAVIIEGDITHSLPMSGSTRTR